MSWTACGQDSSEKNRGTVRRSSRRSTPDSVPGAAVTAVHRMRHTGSDELSPDQIEELDLDDYDTYESALKQELNRTIAQSENRSRNNPNRKENRKAP